MRKLALKVLILCMAICSALCVFTACGGGTNIELSFVVDNEIVQTIKTTGSELIEIPDDPEKTGYTFDGWYWDKGTWETPFTANSLLNAPISKNMSIYAKFKAIEYTATFMADEEQVGTAKFTIEDTEIANIPQVPEKVGYTGIWEEYAIKAEDITINAVYTINKYTVIWQNYDGTVLETDENVEHGTVPEYNGNTPEKPADAQYTYTFDKFEPVIFELTGNITYTATFTYEVNKYTVIWKNYDGTVLETDENVPYGQMPEYNGATPQKIGNQQYSYRFDNVWSPAVDSVKGNAEYIAQFTQVTNKYKITFYDEDGTTKLGESTVDYGTNATYPNDTLTKASDNEYNYTFNKWLKLGTTEEDNLENVVEHRSVYAEYTATPRVYNVYFVENGGNDINDTIYTYSVGLSVLPDENDISRTGYTFEGWKDAQGNAITAISTETYGDVTLYADWQTITYYASFYTEGTLVDIKSFTVEDTVVANVPAVPEKTGYTGEWEEYSILAEDITINAVYAPIEFTITYVNVKTATNNNVTKYTIESEKITLINLDDIDGYNFNCWLDEDDNKITEIPAGSFGNREITAKWDLVEFDLILNYEAERGDYALGTSNPNKYTIESEIILTPLVCNNTGFTFIGWFTEKNNGTGVKIEKIEKNSIGAVQLYAQWGLENYTITYYDVNGAENTNATNYTVETETFTIADLSRTGYTFDGWFNNDDTEADTTITKGSVGNKACYAKWTAIEYDIEYVLYDGTYVADENPAKYTIESSIVFNGLTKDGYRFDGWFDAAQGGNKLTGISVGTYGNKTVYAHWTYISTIIYNSNEGSAVSSTTNPAGTSITAPVAPTKDYYEFVGWYDETLTNKYLFNTQPNEDITLYAKWEPVKYNITYVLNGGNNGDNPAQYTVEQKVELKDASKTGYTFVGWFTNELFNSAVVEEIPLGSHWEVILYANYSINQYTISFETNGGTTIADITRNYESNVTAPLNPAKNGYSFSGWYSDSELKNTYTFTTMPAENITVYAKWTLVNYGITYNLNGGSNGNNPAEYTITSSDITLENPTKIGYEFKGWFTDSNYQNAITVITNGSYGNIELFAKWEIITYTVTYVLPDGATHTNPTSYTIETATVSLTDAEKTGYTFNGWFDAATNGNSVTTFAGGTIGNLTIYGRFTVNDYTVWLDGSEEATYTVEFNLNGKVGTAPMAQTITESKTLQYPIAPTCDGYVFAGWFDNENCEGNAFDFTAVVNKNTVLYAKWIAVEDNNVISVNGTAAVTLNGANDITYMFVPLNSGNVTITTTGSYDTFGALYNDQGVKLVQDDDTGTDSNFQIVYNVTANKAYYIKVRAYSSAITGTCILYLSGNNTVADGGYTVTSSRTTVTFDADFTLTVPETREGYKFLGWEDENGVLYADGTGASVKTWDKAETIVLYSKWERTVYTVTFDTMGGSSIAPVTLAYGDRLDINEYVTTRSGYSFDCWYLDDEVFNATTMPDRNITLEAAWKRYSVGTIKYDETKKAISVHNTVNAELFGVYAIDTDGNFAEFTIKINNTLASDYTLTAGETITIIFAVSNKQITISDVKVYGDPTLSFNNSVNHINIKNGITASWFNASGVDTFGNATQIEISVDGEYSAGNIVKVIIASVDHAGNKTYGYIENVKIYGLPTITYDETKTGISINDTVNDVLFGATATDSFGNNLTVSVWNASTIINVGSSIVIKMSATDSKGNYKLETLYSIKVYGTPTISDAKTTDFKVTDNINVSALGITAKDSFNNAVEVSLSVKSGTQTAGETMVFTATATDVTGNVATKDITVNIYGAPTINYDCETLKDTENPETNVNYLKAMAKDSFGGNLSVTVMLYSGVLSGGERVVYALTATDKLGNTNTVYTEQIPVYGVDGINLTYSKRATDMIKLTSKGEEFLASATDSFGDTCDITVEAASGYSIFAGKTINLYLVATDKAGNQKYSDLISNIRVYGTPIVTCFNIDGVIYESTDIDSMFTVNDSFGEELNPTITVSGTVQVDNYITVTVLATDDIGNVVSEEYIFDVISNDYVLRLNSDGNSYTIVSYTGNESNFTIIESVRDKKITRIGNEAFKNNEAIRGIVIHDYIVDIGDSAFSGCLALQFLYFTGDSITNIGNDAFYNCSALKSVRFFAGINKWCEIHFGNCYSNPIYYAKKLYQRNTEYKTADITASKISNYAFYNCSGITTLILENGLTSIGDNAFYGCTGLTDIIVPDSVISIGSGAFAGCNNLESITIPFVGGSKFATSASETTLFGYIFGTISCTEGKSTTQYYGENSSYVISGITYYVPSSITYYLPLSLKAVTVTGGNILYGAFYNCSLLTSITIPDCVTSIGSSAFRGCSSLISITIPDSIIGIRDKAFYNCSGLTSIIFGENSLLTDIGSNAFYGCPIETAIIPSIACSYIANSNLRTVEITSGERIEGSAFDGCSSLTSVTIGNSVTSIGSSAFNSCASLQEITLPFVGAKKDGTSNTHFGYIFGANSYSSNFSCVPSSLKIVVVSGGTTIPSNAFYGCSGLKHITLPESLTCIDTEAFRNCSALTSIIIPNNVTSIEALAFYDCISLTSVTIGNGVTRLGTEVFYRCYKLVEICNNSVLEISKGSQSNGYVAKYALNVKNDDTSDIVNQNGYLFYKYNDVNYLLGYVGNETELILPNNYDVGNYEIYKYAFYNCSGLTSIIFGENSLLTDIGSNAFYNCINLTSVVIPNSVTNIGSNAFYGCPIETAKIPSIACSYIKNNNLRTVEITSGGSIESQAFYNCSSLTSVTIGNSVTSIGNSAFYKCSSLTEITIPDNVTSIGNSAFSGCSSLTSVTIGNSVTSIGSYAFLNCTKLTKVNNIGTIDSWCEIRFSNEDSNPLYYAKNLYINDELVTRANITTATKINPVAFYNCFSLMSITISDSVAQIGSYAFLGCGKLVEVINNSSLTIKKGSDLYGYVGYYALNVKNDGTSDIVNQNGYLFYKYNDVNYLLGYVGNETELILPNNYDVGNYEIYKYAFYNCSGLTSITIPASVTSIGINAFYGCSLTKVNYIGTIDSWCEIRFSNEGSNPLYYAKNLYINDELVTRADITTATKINSYAFSGCSSLISITIGNSVTSIGEEAFYGCGGLTGVTFKNKSGWKVSQNSDMSGATSLSSSDLVNTSTAATYLKSTYYNYYWKRT